MKFSEFSYSGIKDTAGSGKLRGVNVVCGPNESGKTAMLEALRLAATGKSELGATAKKIDQVIAGNCYASLDDCTYERRGSKTVSSGGEAQGKLPVTVDEFWSLTASDKMGLIASNSSELEGVVEKIDLTKEQIKLTKKELERQPPKAPEPYMGRPVAEVDEDLSTMSLQLAAHRKAAQSAKARQESIEKCQAEIVQIESDISRLRKEEAAEAKRVAAAEADLEQLRPIHARWLEHIDGAPEIMHTPHPSQYIRDKLSQMKEVFSWLSSKGDNRAASMLHAIDGMIVPEFNGLAQSFDEYEEMAQLARSAGVSLSLNISNAKVSTADMEMLKSRRLRAEARVQALKSTAQVEAVKMEGLLSDEVYESILIRHEQAQEERRRAQEWNDFDAVAGAYAVERTKAANLLGELEQKLEELLAQKNSIVMSLKQPVEDFCNRQLAICGMPPIELDIEATARKASLSVKTGGISFEALAASKRLVYGLCLLSAIQMHSDCECPLLLAQCAEMDSAMFPKAIEAMGLRDKGNVILEHWFVPSEVPDGVGLFVKELDGEDADDFAAVAEQRA